jgi:hypothetical protein
VTLKLQHSGQWMVWAYCPEIPYDILTILAKLSISLIIHTYLRFIPEGVVEVSQIFLREVYVLPNFLIGEARSPKMCKIPPIGDRKIFMVTHSMTDQRFLTFAIAHRVHRQLLIKV